MSAFIVAIDTTRMVVAVVDLGFSFTTTPAVRESEKSGGQHVNTRNDDDGEQRSTIAIGTRQKRPTRLSTVAGTDKGR